MKRPFVFIFVTVNLPFLFIFATVNLPPLFVFATVKRPFVFLLGGDVFGDDVGGEVGGVLRFLCFAGAIICSMVKRDLFAFCFIMLIMYYKNAMDVVKEKKEHLL